MAGAGVDRRDWDTATLWIAQKLWVLGGPIGIGLTIATTDGLLRRSRHRRYGRSGIGGSRVTGDGERWRGRIGTEPGNGL